ncbi:hypothetical protein SH611_22415 [Geminicoccaceae bacterium 1502E]|nr:hypothetical protein [Geminicoccaceae bacterium 1502E]
MFYGNGMHPLFEGYGPLAFDIWIYAGNDPLETILEPDYFMSAQNRLKPGDLILAGGTPRRGPPSGPDRTARTERALVMVTESRRDRLAVALVQSFGCVEELVAAANPEGPAAPASRPGA